MDLGGRDDHLKSLYFFLTKHGDARAPNVSSAFIGAIKNEFIKNAKLLAEDDIPVLALDAASRIYSRVSRQSNRGDLDINDCNALVSFFRTSHDLSESEWNLSILDATNGLRAWCTNGAITPVKMLLMPSLTTIVKLLIIIALLVAIVILMLYMVGSLN